MKLTPKQKEQHEHSQSMRELAAWLRSNHPRHRNVLELIPNDHKEVYRWLACNTQKPFLMYEGNWPVNPDLYDEYQLRFWDGEYDIECVQIWFEDLADLMMAKLRWV